MKKISFYLRNLISVFAIYHFKFFSAKRYVESARRHVGIVNDLNGRVFVDLSVISQHDAGTGIQRVVRAIAFQLEKAKVKQEITIIFISFVKERYVRLLVEDGIYSITDEDIDFGDGDMFLGLDFSLDSLWKMRRELIRMRRIGVRFWYVIYDFLPVIQPQWFSKRLVLRFSNWLVLMAGTADRFLCISEPVARQLPQIMKRHLGVSLCPPAVVMPMGWDLAGSRPSSGLPEGFSDLFEAAFGR
ncbi:hypothetical protein ACN4EK_32205 [Pantanalinema rosaneae CENA516]|uniref:hypothetical protein n=1 Tax=Pantanalinema rosaneae TaxID=1620701 RepID=UPI003D6E304B